MPIRRPISPLRVLVQALSVAVLASACGESGTTTEPVCEPACGAGAACASVLDVSTCVCLPGYTGDGTTCSPVVDDAATEADSGSDAATLGCAPACGANAACVGTTTPTCVCDSGYAKLGASCTDVDECAAGNPCGANTACTNTPGSYTCACAAGYSFIGSTCVDVDECVAPTNPCGANTACTNSPGSYACACLTGYANGGSGCVDVNECSAGQNPCGVGVVCNNTAGSYTCGCGAGYVMGTSGCVLDIDECANGTDDCDPNATCTNTADAFACACNPGFTGDGTSCAPGVCDPGADPDTGTATFTITHLGLTSSTGFNLDGLDNSPAPAGSGVNVPGCGRVDGAGGIDNALAVIAQSLASIIDLPAAFQNAVTPGAGGAPADLTITVTLTHLAAGNVANDPCIGVEMLAHATGSPDASTSGSGALVNNVSTLYFDGTWTLPVVVDVPSAACVNSMCNPATLHVPISGLRARITLNAAHTALTSGSIFGGYLFFSDATAGYEALNPAGFQAELAAWAADVNLASSFTTMAIQAFSGARDLHMQVDGSLAPCTGANTSTVDKNTLSTGFTFDSL